MFYTGLMTFDEAVTRLREERLNEPATGGNFTPTQLRELLLDASKEIAAELGFPKAFVTLNLLAGDTSISTLSLVLPGFIRAIGITIGGITLDNGTLEQVALASARSGAPAVFYHDPDDNGGSLIHFAPALSSNRTANVRYLKTCYHGVTVTGTTEVWEGKHPGFHELVILKGALKAWGKTGEDDRAGVLKPVYDEQYMKFAQYLAGVNVSELGKQQVKQVGSQA